MNKLLKSRNWLALLGLMAVAALLALPLFAQDNGTANTTSDDSAIIVTGAISFANDQITVAGYIIAPAGAFQPSQFNEGDIVVIEGNLLPDGVTIQATDASLFDDSSTPEATETPEA